jgi:hypothetical protein
MILNLTSDMDHMYAGCTLQLSSPFLLSTIFLKPCDFYSLLSTVSAFFADWLESAARTRVGDLVVLFVGVTSKKGLCLLVCWHLNLNGVAFQAFEIGQAWGLFSFGAFVIYCVLH